MRTECDHGMPMDLDCDDCRADVARRLSEIKPKHGFARMTPEQRREIASRGGRAAAAKGVGHRFSSGAEAKAAGAKGGAKATREHLAAAGRKGGVTRRERAAARATCQHTAQTNVGDKIRCEYCHAELRSFVVIDGKVIETKEVVIKIDPLPAPKCAACNDMGTYLVPFHDAEYPEQRRRCLACRPLPDGTAGIELVGHVWTDADEPQKGFL